MNATAKSRRGNPTKEVDPRERSFPFVPLVHVDGRPVQIKKPRNRLIANVIEQFCPRWVAGGQLLHARIDGAGSDFLEKDALAKLGVSVDEHGKMPDVVVYCAARDWLMLIEAVTSHGPVSAKRHQELKELFKDARPGLVYVTAFLDRRGMARYLSDIAWETEVWVAESPTHLIHFNGIRFLGPYACDAPAE